MDKPKSAVVQNGKFEVWDNGTVYRINKYGAKTLCTISRTGRNKNYCTVSCRLDGKQKHFYVHRLVAEAFIPNPLNLPQINHIDGDPTNNHVSNLEWCTPKQNIDHAYQNGLMNPYINSEPCKMCGEPTAAKDGICTECKRKLKIAAHEESKAADLQEELASIDINILNYRDRDIVQMRMTGMTLQEIGDVYGYSKEYIRQIIERAKIKSRAVNKSSSLARQEMLKLAKRIERKTTALETAKMNVMRIENELSALEANYELLCKQAEGNAMNQRSARNDNA